MDANMMFKAAREGNLEVLSRAFQENPSILDDIKLISLSESILHVATKSGQLSFVHELMKMDPDMARELNKDGFRPLDIAVIMGKLAIVKTMLSFDRDLGRLKGRDNRSCLHYAAVKGRVEIIEELMSQCPDGIEDVSVHGETALHLAVKNYQLDAFTELVKWVERLEKMESIFNVQDGDGNTVLHLAVSTKQYTVVDLLLNKSFDYKDKLELNSLNQKGQTPLDVLLSEGGDTEIEEILTLCGATRASQNMLIVTEDQPNNEQEQERTRARPESASQKLLDYFKYDKVNESPSQARNTLLVIAVLIATATYQAVLSPPGGVWQDDFWPDSAKNSSSDKQPPAHTAGQSVMQTHKKMSYGLFLLFNSIGFFMSLHMMNFLTTGLPMQFELRVALYALIGTYDTCMTAISPNGVISVFFIVVSVVMPMVIPVLTWLVRDFKKEC